MVFQNGNKAKGFKKSHNGLKFGKNDPRIQKGGSPQNCFPGDKARRLREPKSVYDSVSAGEGGIPPGARLRPYDDSKQQIWESNLETSQNWIMNDAKFLEAFNHALKCHDTKNRTNHTAIFKKYKNRKIGFGLNLSFKCGFRNCKFQSQLYEMYDKTSSG